MNPRKLLELCERLYDRKFDYAEWQSVADIHEKHGHKTKARELRKEAATKYLQRSE